jgi:hypothetical protein
MQDTILVSSKKPSTAGVAVSVGLPEMGEPDLIDSLSEDEAQKLLDLLSKELEVTRSVRDETALTFEICAC